MSWRVVMISNSAKLDYQLGYMVVRQSQVTRIYIGEIHTLIIETTAVSITTALLAELVKAKVMIVFCDEKRHPSAQLVPYYGSHDTSEKLRKQIRWKEAIKGEVWESIVRDKIHQQANLLMESSKEEYVKLMEYEREVISNDMTNREGHAAKVYFHALFGKDFSRGSDSLINVALNYGYTLILACFTREIVASGYVTQLGLFHDNMFNQFNLASDLMEPFRVLVDRKIYSMIFSKFETEEKQEILGLLHEQIRINGRKETVINGIRIYCKSVFFALENEDIHSIQFYRYEL